MKNYVIDDYEYKIQYVEYNESGDNTNFPVQLLPIVKLFKEDCNSNKLKECYIDQNRLFIKGSNKDGLQNELLLRFAVSS